jgi:hypothetical protein
MLKLILNDFLNFDAGKVSATVHNSLLSIVNRYIIRYRDPFFSYLESIQLPFLSFLDAYFHNMEFLTSHAAMYRSDYTAKSMLWLYSPFLTHLTSLYCYHTCPESSQLPFQRWNIISPQSK